jgi:hypothetical protein
MRWQPSSKSTAPGLRAAAADRRHRHRGGARPGFGGQILRSPTALSPGTDLRSQRHRSRSLNSGELGRARVLVVATARGAAARHDPVIAQDLRRRHTGAGARSRARPRQDRAAVGLCPGRPAMARADAAGRRLCLQREPTGRASEEPPSSQAWRRPGPLRWRKQGFEPSVPLVETGRLCRTGGSKIDVSLTGDRGFESCSLTGESGANLTQEGKGAINWTPAESEAQEREGFRLSKPAQLPPPTSSS